MRDGIMWAGEVVEILFSVERRGWGVVDGIEGKRVACFFICV